MKKIIPYFQLIRPINLGIIFLTQFIFYFFVLLPTLHHNELKPILNISNFWFLSLSTILIAAAGNVINDIKDVEIDHHNRHQKQIVSKTITINAAWFFYIFLIIFGAYCFGIVCFHTKKLIDFSLFIGLTCILYWYSAFFKRSLLMGNLIISTLCTAVILIIYHFEYQNHFILQKNLESIDKLDNTLMFYSVFAFLSTLIRELIKDCEDIEGDKLHHCNTFPIVFGTKLTKLFIIILAMIFLYFYMSFALTILFTNATIFFYIALISVLIPLLITIFKVFVAKTKEDFGNASRLAKILMLSGIMVLILLNIENFKI
jgi:4-hydroxybenzoate polyprenyltransferase